MRTTHLVLLWYLEGVATLDEMYRLSAVRHHDVGGYSVASAIQAKLLRLKQWILILWVIDLGLVFHT